MRIAAGVLLIIAALVNFVSGCGYSFAGAVVGGVGAAGSAIMEEAAKADDNEASAVAQQQAADLGQVASEGGNMALYGMFVMILGAVEIGAGVVLFVGVAAMFIRITAALEIVSILIAVGVYGVVTVMSVPGVLGAVLALIAAQSLAAGGGSGPPVAVADDA